MSIVWCGYVMQYVQNLNKLVHEILALIASATRQRSLRRVCAHAQTRQGNRCSHTQCINVEEDPDQGLLVSSDFAHI